MSPFTWIEFRESMPVAKNWAYFDHAAVGPLSGPARDVLQVWLEQATEQGDTVWLDWAAGVERTRRHAAALLGTNPENIALVPNTTLAINYVAEGFPWRSGDNVVLPADEFPSNAYPWLNLAGRGVEARRVKSPLSGTVDWDAVFSACDERTRMISISWVGFASGWRIDVDELVERAHARGILVFLDAIQGLGIFPLDVQTTPVDFLAADGHKWMLGPEGAGIFYVRPEHLDLLRPIGVGWHSVTQAADFDRIEPNWKPATERYEGGSQNMSGHLALGASLELLLKYDVAEIGQRILEVTDFACAQLQSVGANIFSHREVPERCSGIVSFEIPGQDPNGVRKHCLANGVALACRGGRLRISPHAYQNEADVERLVSALKTA